MSKFTVDQIEIGKKILARKKLEIPYLMLSRTALLLADRAMTDEDRGELMHAIAAYVLNGEVIETSPIVGVVMEMIQKDVEHDQAGYAYTVAHNAYAGWCSANKKKDDHEAMSFQEWLPGWLDS